MNNRQKGENELSKMFLLSYPAYEKFKEKLKEMESLRLLNNEMQTILSEKPDNNDKWNQYRNLLVKQKQQMQNKGTPVNEIAKTDHALEMIDKPMKGILKSSKPSNDAIKWLRYRQLLLKRAHQQRNREMSKEKSNHKRKYPRKGINNSLVLPKKNPDYEQCRSADN